MGRTIGIDLGTTNSCVAIVEGGRPRVVPLRGGARVIPSVLAVNEKGQVLVGEPAKRQAQLNPENTVIGSKRLIGRNYHSDVVERFKRLFAYEVVEGENGGVQIHIADRFINPEQVSAAMLKKIRVEATESLGEQVTSAVITVPAYFNARQREAVRKAGEAAKLRVLRVLGEPTAAAIAFGLGKDLNQKVAIYDMGGGTFDVSIIHIRGRIFKVLATGGDTFLGGVDVDDRLYRYVVSFCQDNFGFNPGQYRSAVQRIRDAVEEAKKELSSRMTAKIDIPFLTFHEGQCIDLHMEVTRAQFEHLIQDIVQRTIDTTERIMEDAGCDASEIGEVLLVGGSTRTPLVQQRVGDFIGRPPSKAINPDEAVALGAAVLAEALSAGGGGDIVLRDVVPMDIGYARRDGSMNLLFRHNQPMPTAFEGPLKSGLRPDGSMMVPIYQGESANAKENEVLGIFWVPNAPRTPEGHGHVIASLMLDPEGILSVGAKHPDTGETIPASFMRGARRRPGA